MENRISNPHASLLQWSEKQRGYATATVILVMLVTLVGGAYLLKRVKNQAAATGGYYQARSAALAAQAGLTAGLAQFQTDPTVSIDILNAYVADTNNHWLLGTGVNAGTRHEITMDNGLQRFAARIVNFNPKTTMVKVKGEGLGPGGSKSEAFGVYQLGGIAAVPTATAKYAWFMAGEARNVDQPVDVSGDAYFGGGVHFNGGANGSIMRGSVKIASGSGIETTCDALVTFMGNTYIMTPFKTQGGGVRFQSNAGFKSNLSIFVDPIFSGTGLTAYYNGKLTAGSSKFQMANNKVVHSGLMTAANFSGTAAGNITNKGGTVAIATALGMTDAIEDEMHVDFSKVPAASRFTFSSLAIGGPSGVSGADLTSAYNAKKAAGKLYNGFLVVQVNSAMNFAAVTPNVISGKFYFEVTSSVAVNTNLPVSDPTSVCLWHFTTGASVTSFGGAGLFRGYVNVDGNASIIYQWKPGVEIRGAIHHVTSTCSFQLNSLAGSGALKMTADGGVFEDLSPLGVLVPPSGSPPPPGVPAPGAPVVAAVKLIDMKIRPLMFSRWF